MSATAVIDRSQMSGEGRVDEIVKAFRAMNTDERRDFRRRFGEALGDEGVWIYVIQAGDDGPVKIGRTHDLPARFRRLQHANGEQLRLVGAWRTLPAEEKELHAEFAELRLRGEWFEPHWSILDTARKLNTWEGEL